MNNYIIKMILLMIKEDDGTESIYFDLFSEDDVEKIIQARSYRVLSFVNFPLQDYYELKEEFIELHKEFEIQKDNKLFPKKMTYSLPQISDYQEVINWILSKRKKYKVVI